MDDVGDDWQEEMAGEGQSQLNVTDASSVPSELDTTMSRLKLQEMIDQLKEERSELVNLSSTRLEEHIDQLNTIFTQMQSEMHLSTDGTLKVTLASQVCLDFKAFNLIASINHERIRSIAAGTWTFRPKEFAEKIAITVCNPPEGLEATMNEAGKQRILGLIYPYCQKLITPWRPMLGSFQLDETDKISKERQIKQSRMTNFGATETRVVRPVSVDPAARQNKDLVEDYIIHVKQLLRKHTRASKAPISYYKFVVDPNSFARTVENIFYVSFLFKNGEASLTEDENGLPVIRLTSGSDQDAEPCSISQEKQQKAKAQIIVNMTMEFWEELVRILQVSEPMITALAKSNTRQSTQ